MKNYHALLVPGHYYHVFNRGNNREIIFSTDSNYLFFLRKVEKYLLPYLRIFAYCLMPNHFHFLIQVREEEELMENVNLTKLSKFSKVKSSPGENELEINKFLEERFQRFFISYSLSYNKQENRTGSLFQKRFKRIHINSDVYLMKVIHYIHANPIHHHYCTNYSDWQYSSYNAIIGNLKTNVDRKSVLIWFDNLEYFIEFHEQTVDYNEINNFLIDDE